MGCAGSVNIGDSGDGWIQSGISPVYSFAVIGYLWFGDQLTKERPTLRLLPTLAHESFVTTINLWLTMLREPLTALAWCMSSSL